MEAVIDQPVDDLCGRGARLGADLVFHENFNMAASRFRMRKLNGLSD
jgi:hypothetical protein